MSEAIRPHSMGCPSARLNLVQRAVDASRRAVVAGGLAVVCGASLRPAAPIDAQLISLCEQWRAAYLAFNRLSGDYGDDPASDAEIAAAGRAEADLAWRVAGTPAQGPAGLEAKAEVLQRYIPAMLVPGDTMQEWLTASLLRDLLGAPAVLS